MLKTTKSRPSAKRKLSTRQHVTKSVSLLLPRANGSCLYAIRFSLRQRPLVVCPPRTASPLLARAPLDPRDRDASCGVDETRRKRTELGAVAAFL